MPSSNGSCRPDDNARRAVWDAGQRGRHGHTGGMVCAAVFLNGRIDCAAEHSRRAAATGASAAAHLGVIVLAASATATATTGPPTRRRRSPHGHGNHQARVGGWEQATKVAFDTLQRAQQEYARLTPVTDWR
jgi:hypothetical protein